MSGTPSTSLTSINAWWTILRRTGSEVISDRVPAVAGGVTFFGLLSLFPAITVLMSFYGLIADPAAVPEHLQALASVVPQGALAIIGEQVRRIIEADQSKLGVAAIAGLVVALWSANSAMKSMMDALDIAYDTEEKRGFLVLNLVSLGFTLAAIAGFIVMITVIAVVPAMIGFLKLGPLGDVLLWAGRWPAPFSPSGWAMPISSPAPAAWAKPPRRGSWPRRSTASSSPRASRAVAVTAAPRSTRAPPMTCRSSTRRRTTASRTSASSWEGPTSVPPGEPRCTSSTRSTC